MFQSQIELEHKVMRLSQLKAKDEQASRAAKGSGHLNTYGNPLLTKYIPLVVEKVTSDILEYKDKQRMPSRLAVLVDLRIEEVALLAINCATDTIAFMLNTEDHEEVKGGTARTLGTAIGSMVTTAHMMMHMDTVEPKLYHRMVQDMAQKKSVDMRYKRRVFTRAMDNAQIEYTHISDAVSVDIGNYLIGVLEEVGYLHVILKTRKKRRYRDVYPSHEVLDTIMEVSSRSVDMAYANNPLIEPPLDWTGPYSGGYYTEEARLCAGPAVSTDLPSNELEALNLEPLYRVLNILQRTRWRINRDMLSIVPELLKATGHKDLKVSQNYPPEAPDVPYTDWSTSEEVKAWKLEMSKWYSRNKADVLRIMLMGQILAQARSFVDYPVIWFSWFADFRYRLYPRTRGLSPQGNDLAKALLEFAEGKPVVGTDGAKWMRIAGANLYGYDSAHPDLRARWTLDNEQMILDIARDPVNNRGWEDADSPLQFVAWCRDYRAFKARGEAHMSHLPVGIDGTCNGFQHFSAMLRDAIGGKAVNLCNTGKLEKEDIYALVAEYCVKMLRDMEHTDLQARTFLSVDIDRDVTKRPVMTTPYGVTAIKSARYVYGQMLDRLVNGTDTPDLFKHCMWFVMNVMEPSIASVAVKSIEAMGWLKEVAGTVTDEYMRWTTPYGLEVVHAYPTRESMRIKSVYQGRETKLTIEVKHDTPSVADSAGGLPPNFIHSMDGAHAHLVIREMDKVENTYLAMTHDDYATHVADLPRLARVTREQFVQMYTEHDPIKDLAEAYGIAEYPQKGDLDLSEVLDSPYFFS